MEPRLDLIGIVTDDMAASLAFYRRLGVPVPDLVEKDAPHVEAVLPGGLRLAWDSAEMVRSITPEWDPRPAGQRVGLAFLCDGPAEVDRTYAELVAAGHPGEQEPWDAFWGQRYAVVRDPDGNSVDLFAPLPVNA
ncbi:VOC family protein [Streptomyces litchfieldiae]|uniref:VOC family protein n=1 Tax=Streptomyces litchfieldiae TaxID=3075543 RepID=A0ABU2MKQ4_9ACTN|nr:VOC family protein [Streptomyces sp. DSM 44938]MDT0342185.1 VOC family protein [Streptomyces sp. DSM 44938]